MRIQNLASLILILLLSVCTHAQSYIPIQDTNAIWKEVFVVFSPGHSCSTVRDEYVMGDTTIGSQTYIKIYATGNVYCDSITYYFHDVYQGAIRNDSSGRRVYFIEHGDSTEQLLYDYSLAVGQMSPSSSVFFNQYTITYIDSVYYLNSWHQRFHTSDFGPNGELMFIEGMGSNYGLTQCYCSPLMALYCYYQDDRPCYPDTSSGCVTPVSVTEPIITDRISLFPNPASQFLNVKIPWARGGQLSVFNSNGQVVLERQIAIEGEVVLDITALPEGMYILGYCAESGEWWTKKFVVD